MSAFLDRLSTPSPRKKGDMLHQQIIENLDSELLHIVLQSKLRSLSSPQAARPHLRSVAQQPLNRTMLKNLLSAVNEAFLSRETERESVAISFGNPLTATCDGGTFRPASERENREKTRKRKIRYVNTTII